MWQKITHGQMNSKCVLNRRNIYRENVSVGNKKYWEINIELYDKYAVFVVASVSAPPHRLHTGWFQCSMTTFFTKAVVTCIHI